jgi:hypothetical protein
MHSGIASLSTGQLAVAHPEGHRLLLVDGRNARADQDVPAGPREDRTGTDDEDGRDSNEPGRVEVSTPLTELHSIFRTTRDGGDLLWVADNGHRYVAGPAGYEGQTRPGRAVLIDLDGLIVQELECALPVEHLEPRLRRRRRRPGHGVG